MSDWLTKYITKIYNNIMRVKLSKANLKYVFQRLPKVKFLASRLDVSERTIRGWVIGKHSIPCHHYEEILRMANIPKKLIKVIMFEDFSHNKEAGRKGALARMKKYGNFGTPEGRRKGGIASCLVQKTQNSNFKTLKEIKIPRPSGKLAEFMGILFGDGHLSDYQVSVTTGLKTDCEHAKFVKSLIEDLFHITVTTRIISSRNTIIVYASSKKLVAFLNKKGMPIGNKINKNITIPHWIQKSKVFSLAFIRGLFDTDGCLYVDKHIRNTKTYKHLGWTITSYAPNIISGTIELLKKLDYSPTHTPRQKSVFVRKQKEIVRYFDEISSNNPKHLSKYINFYGRVPKWS